MVAQIQARPMDVTRANVAAWVQAHIDRGIQPNDAYRLVFEDMERLDQLADLAKLLGPQLVGDIWRETNRALRPSSDGVIYRPDQQVVQTDREVAAASGAIPRPMSGAPPAPVFPIPVNTKARTYLDGMEKVGSEWVYVRHLSKAQCEALAKTYENQAKPLLHNKRYFLAIAAALGEGEVVGQKFDDQKLGRLYRMTKP